MDNLLFCLLPPFWNLEYAVTLYDKPCPSQYGNKSHQTALKLSNMGLRSSVLIMIITIILITGEELKG